MEENIEKTIRSVYRQWKAMPKKAGKNIHPDEDTLVCFIEGRLSKDESEKLKGHFLACESCSELIAASLRLTDVADVELAKEVIEQTEKTIDDQLGAYVLEIILRLKEKALELLGTTGDVLVGQELVPAAVLRSRSIKDFADEVTVLKDFKDIRVEAKIESSSTKDFNLTVTARQKQNLKPLKNARITLIKDDVELESYLSDTGKVQFEHIPAGNYCVVICAINEKLATLTLRVNI